VLHNGDRTDPHHKRVLPIYDVFDEHQYFRPGEEPLVGDVADTGVGIIICEDAWHDTIPTGTRRHPRSGVRKRWAEYVFVRWPRYDVSVVSELRVRRAMYGKSNGGRASGSTGST